MKPEANFGIQIFHSLRASLTFYELLSNLLIQKRLLNNVFAMSNAISFDSDI